MPEELRYTFITTLLLTIAFWIIIRRATILLSWTFLGYTPRFRLPGNLTLASLFKNLRTTSPFPTSEKHYATIDSIHSLLAPSRVPAEQLLRERAQANARLAQALGLTNTFVDSAPQIHANFVRRSRGLLKDVQTSGWTRFRETCGKAVHQTLHEYSRHLSCSSTSFPTLLTPLESSDKNIPFDHFVQIVVLRTILVGFLNVGKDVEELEFSSLALIAARINDLWALSKTGASIPHHLSKELHDHLRLLIPPLADFHNPIDFVVPTWETMWRVCATTLAHICEAQVYETAFQEFHQADEVSMDEFNLVRNGNFSIRNFVDEAMRLHPPSKRITRLRPPEANDTDAFSSGTGYLNRLLERIVGTNISNTRPATPVREVAEIQSVLLSQAIWSQDSHNFNPQRYQTAPSHCEQQVDFQRKEALKLIFGHGPLRCVAASWAPMAAAIISGAILEECSGIGWDIVRGPSIGGRLGWDGWQLVNRKLGNL